MRVRETPVVGGVVVVVAATEPARADKESEELFAPPEQAARRATSGRTRSFFICSTSRGERGGRSTYRSGRHRTPRARDTKIFVTSWRY